jgi:O-antigen/teichoic acid export membrane protein
MTTAVPARAPVSERAPVPGQRTAKVGGDFAVVSAGWLVRAAVGVLVSALIARALAPSEMGRYTFLVWLAGLLPLLLSLGLPTTITRYTAELIRPGRTRIGRALLALAVGVQAPLALVAALAVALSALLPTVASSWTTPLLLTAASIALLMMSGTLTAFLSGLHVFRLTAAVATGQLLLLAALVAGVVAAGAGVTALMAAHAAVNAVALGALALLALRATRPSPASAPAERLSPSLRGELLRYAAVAGVLIVVDAIVWQRTEVAFLQRWSTSQEVAFYGLAFGLATQVSRVPYQASVVLFPRFPEAVGAGRVDELPGLYASAIRYLVLVGAPLAIGLAATAPAIVRVLYGAPYAPAAPLLAALALGSLPAFAAGITPAVLHAVKRQDCLVRTGLAAASVDVALAVLLVPRWGAAGAATANVAAQALASVLAVRAAGQAIGAGFPVRRVARIIVAAVLMGVPAALIAAHVPDVRGLLAALTVGAVTYPLALGALGALVAEDVDRARVLCERLPRPIGRPVLATVRALCRAAPGPAGR